MKVGIAALLRMKFSRMTFSRLTFSRMAYDRITLGKLVKKKMREHDSVELSLVERRRDFEQYDI